MAHANSRSSKATPPNAVSDSVAPNDQAQEQTEGVHSEPRSYVAADVADASLAAGARPAVGGS